jgi:hypothetical protein
MARLIVTVLRISPETACGARRARNIGDLPPADDGETGSVVATTGLRRVVRTVAKPSWCPRPHRTLTSTGRTGLWTECAL